MIRRHTARAALILIASLACTEFPVLARHDYRANRLRSASYLPGPMGGAPRTVPRHYIEQQNQPT